MKTLIVAVLFVCAGWVSAQPGAEAPPESVAWSIQHMKDRKACEAAGTNNNVAELIEWSRNPHPNLRGDAIRSATLLKPAERITFALALTDDPVFRLPRPGRDISYLTHDENIRTLLGLIFGEEFSAGSFYDDAFRGKIRGRLLALQAGAPNAVVPGASGTASPTASEKKADPARGPLDSPAIGPPTEKQETVAQSPWLLAAAFMVAALVGYLVKRRRP